MQSSRPVCSRWLGIAFGLERYSPVSELPVFLCPALRRSSPLGAPRHHETTRLLHQNFLVLHGPRRTMHTCVDSSNNSTEPALSQAPHQKTLPAQCHGCGALSQTTTPGEAGFFDMERKQVRKYLGIFDEVTHVRKEDQLVEDLLRSVDQERLKEMGVNLSSLTGKLNRQVALSPPKQPDKFPLCDRCHQLVHHHTGKSIAHPTIEALRDTIQESPFKYNHVYHVLDAADFPMSLLPRINQLLNMLPLRTKNRRSQGGKFLKGRSIELSFVITRSDILAPTKDKVDSLMPYLKDVLRDALGRTGRHVRLGNVRCVSAKRGWWVKELKEEIWTRGGGGWMVGKVNVGKSQLFEGVFPKGRMDRPVSTRHITIPVSPGALASTSQPMQAESASSHADPFAILESPDDPGPLDELSLLPPAQEETNYPAMPVVSSLPGTTASPIRIPYGNGKGELIDLPGLSRGDLELHVKEEHRSALVMKSRIEPEQQVLKPGQSLVLGGLVRITPRTPDLIFLAYNFTPIPEHLTSTEKAIAIQEQTEEAPTVENIALPGTGATVKHAGTFSLTYDVTQKRAGPITRRNAANISVSLLPYRVFALDILIEGCGWVEIAAQVRTRHLLAPREQSELAGSKSDDALSPFESTPNSDRQYSNEQEDLNWPVVDVFTPEGRFIGSRKPMNGWLLNKPKTKHLKKRPRKSMKGAKKQAKLMRRAAEAASRSILERHA